MKLSQDFIGRGCVWRLWEIKSLVKLQEENKMTRFSSCTFLISFYRISRGKEKTWKICSQFSFNNFLSDLGAKQLEIKKFKKIIFTFLFLTNKVLKFSPLFSLIKWTTVKWKILHNLFLMRFFLLLSLTISFIGKRCRKSRNMVFNYSPLMLREECRKHWVVSYCPFAFIYYKNEFSSLA